MNQLSDAEFAGVGARMRAYWDGSLEDPQSWLGFRGFLLPRNMCTRWFIDGDGSIRLTLEEHRDHADAFWAERRNDGSIAPLRSITHIVVSEPGPKGVTA